jgi:hypothetical protein
MPRGSGRLSGCGRSVGATRTERSAVGACRIRKRRGCLVRVRQYPRAPAGRVRFPLAAAGTLFEIALALAAPQGL